MKERLIIIGSLSKTYAMTGWRLGYALGPAPIISAMKKLQSQSTSNPDFDRAEGSGGGADRLAGLREADAGRLHHVCAIRSWRDCARFPASLARRRMARSTPIPMSAIILTAVE